MKSLPEEGRGDRTIADLPRRGAWRGKDVHHARGGAPAAAAWHRCGDRLCRNTWSRKHTEELIGDLGGRARARRSSTEAPLFTEMDVDAVLARRPQVALVDELAHTNVPGSRQRQALARHRGAARGRDHRALHGEHPAPGVAQRRGVPDHRHRPTRDRARRGRPAGRPGRADRHDSRGAAPPDGARQHLSGRQDRRRTGQLLPGRQSHRAA